MFGASRTKWPAIVLAAAVVCVLVGSLPFAAEVLAPAPGRLLVASEAIEDPRFRRTVILLIEHESAGTVGLILNRPTGNVLDALPNAHLFPAGAARVYYGGPVGGRTLLALAGGCDPTPAAKSVGDGVFVTGVGEIGKAEIREEEPKPRLRIFAGYAGWGPGQLDRELVRGDWQVYPGDEDLYFRSGVGSLWFDVQESAERDWI